MNWSAQLERVYRVQDTHGILTRPEHTIRASSEDLGWGSLYASLQHEAPYEACFGAVEDHLLILHLGGPVAVERDLGGKRERRIVPAGGLFILPGGTDFGVRLEGELDTLHIYLRHEMMCEVAADLGLYHDRVDLEPYLGEPDLLLEQLALGVSGALTDGDPGAKVYADYLSRLLAARLLRRFSSERRRPIAVPGGLSAAQLNRVADFIEAHLHKTLSLADIARACALSPTYFARQFKDTTGLPPHQFLIQMRIERAKRLLKGSTPIVEIALDCGFTHQEHLTNVFRRQTGLTPAAFRRAAQS